MADHVDVLIVGAGLSGIGMAYHLSKACPDKTFTLLENRAAIGGTWDLFRYPGIRSDSDMYTLGYRFKPWTGEQAIADGDKIRAYINDVADENGLRQHIRFRHDVIRAEWSSEDNIWSVDARNRETEETVHLTCNFFISCAGYYDYDEGFTPDFDGTEDFRGEIIHPQFWPEDLDYAGKQVIVIGSGATAVTLVPEMAEEAGHVTMLQRSPSFVTTRPERDKLALGARKFLPPKLAYSLTRLRKVLSHQQLLFWTTRFREQAKQYLINGVRKELGPDYDVEKHFRPSYFPWDQRVCVVPDGDLFASIREGRVSVVTDHIDRFTETGLQLKSGQSLDADIIVTATGLKLKPLGGVEFVVDGNPVTFGDTLQYKGMMFSNIPNLASVFGYTNSSWTLKADLISDYLCRLLNHMSEIGAARCVPVSDPPAADAKPWVNFTSGYVLRAIDKFPKLGEKAPWHNDQDFLDDFARLKFGKLDDGIMAFAGAPKTGAPSKETEPTPTNTAGLNT